MVGGTKYICDRPFYVYLKKHFCPKCKNKLKVRYISEIVNSKSDEAKKYDFRLGNVYMKGNVKFKTACFHCTNCSVNLSIEEMKIHEKTMKTKLS